MLDAKTKTFLTVCDVMNFTKAAARLNLSQPAVSAHIHALEEWYRVKLFLYEGKKLLLTPEGETLRKAMTVMWNDEKTLRQKVLEPRVTREQISFGVTMTIGEFIIADPLARFIRSHKDAYVNMEIANTESLTRKIREGQLQFALVEGAFDAEEFDSMLYRTVPFVPVCASRHTFTKEPRQLQDLLSETLILREKGSGTRNILERQLSVLNLSVDDFTHSITIGGMHTIMELIAVFIYTFAT